MKQIKVFVRQITIVEIPFLGHGERVDTRGILVTLCHRCDRSQQSLDAVALDGFHA